MEFAIIVGIIVTVFSLLAYEDYLWKEEIRLRQERQEECKRQEAERNKKMKKDPVGDLVASILLAGLAQGLEAYAKDCAANK